jgi:TonB family protein
MPTTANDSSTELFVTGSAPSAKGAGNGSPSGRRTDAVGVEIPVIVHASRTSVSARDIAKPQPPVHEETRTVIVFPQGAVVRLTATFAANELVVLTNQRSGADVICRVVSVKAQPGIQNYVDLEFTQRAPNFWGDCFPADRLQASSAAGLTLAPAPPAVTVMPAFTKPATVPPVSLHPVSAPPVSVHVDVPEPVAPVAMAPLAAQPAVFSSLPAPRPEAPAVPPTARASSVSSPGMGQMGMELMHPVESQQAAWPSEAQARTSEATSDSKKTILMAAAAVVLLVLVAGGAMILRQNHSVAGATQSIPAAPSGAISQASSAPPAVANAVAPETPAAASASPTLTADARPVSSPDSAAARPAGSPSNTAPKQPDRKAIAIVMAKPSHPLIQNGNPASPSEPPPLLPASAGAASLGSNLLVSSESAGPVSPAVRPAVVATGGEIQQPKLIASTPPIYPPQANAQHIQGDVVVDALVNTNGKVTSAKVISGPPLLQQAALNALRGWTYQPARLDGEVIATHVQVKITFRLP